MNVKKLLLAALAVFVTFQVLDFLIHSVLLMDLYEANPTIWRPDMMELMWLMYISGAGLALLFVYIFAKGYQGKGIMEGARYGLLMGLLLAVIAGINQYVVYPVPLNLSVYWVISGLIEFIIAGTVAALIYKPKV